MSLSVAFRHRFEGFALDVAFSTPEGVTALFGRSGSGKTTIANAVAGLIRPESGRIALGGRALFDAERGVCLPPRRRRIGYIFQEGRLFPHLSVRGNLLYGRRVARREEAGADFDRVVEMLGLGALLERRPARLSGGEKQRVAIGRALLSDPELLVADEPLAALDEARKAEVLPFFERLRDEARAPILYVSHSATEVARLATTVVALQDGRVLRQGPAIDMLGDPTVTPAGARAAGAVLEAAVARHHADGLSELVAGEARILVPAVALPPGARLRVRVAAQEVILSRRAPEGLSALNILPGEVASVRAGAGPGALVSVRTPAGLLLARVTRRSAQALNLAAGGACFAIVKAVAVAPEDVGG